MVRNWSASAAEPRIDHALRIFERDAGAFQCAQIGPPAASTKASSCTSDPPALWITRPSARRTVP